MPCHASNQSTEVAQLLRRPFRFGMEDEHERGRDRADRRLDSTNAYADTADTQHRRGVQPASPRTTFDHHRAEGLHLYSNVVAVEMEGITIVITPFRRGRSPPQPRGRRQSEKRCFVLFQNCAESRPDRMCPQESWNEPAG